MRCRSPELAVRVSQIDERRYNAVVLLDDDARCVRREEQFAERLRYYVDIARRSMQRRTWITDLRFKAGGRQLAGSVAGNTERDGWLVRTYLVGLDVTSKITAIVGG
jgi:hypothetical protein